MSVLTSASQNLKAANRRILVMGPPGSGKTTLSISASAHAGDTIPSKHLQMCSDVVLLSGDQEGVQGALDANLEPRAVVDMTTCADWVAYQKLLADALSELRPLVAAGEVKIIVVDLALPAKLIIDQIKPADIAGWGRVGAEGVKLYRIFGALPGATIIGNVQIKSATGAVENAVAAAAADAKAVGGERATFTADLPKSVLSPWMENSSLALSRESKRVKDTSQPGAPLTRKFSTHTQSNAKFEAKSRFGSKLLQTEPGERTLHSLLVQAYGENL